MRKNPSSAISMAKEPYAIGDPQILTPDEFDGKWHMLYHSF